MAAPRPPARPAGAGREGRRFATRRPAPALHLAGAFARRPPGDGPERVYGEWWRKSGEADAVRDYFQVEDEEGRRFWLYRRGDGFDPRTGDLSWWLQGAFG